MLKQDKDHTAAGNSKMHTQLSGTAVMEMKTR